MTLATTKEEWVTRAKAQYLTHDVSPEKAEAWAVSRWHNIDSPLQQYPEDVAEKDLASWVKL